MVSFSWNNPYNNKLFALCFDANKDRSECEINKQICTACGVKHLLTQNKIVFTLINEQKDYMKPSESIAPQTYGFV